MCVVATYVIMHVIVYFGVCKCHGCSSHLCKWMFNLVMQACPYKCVYIYVVVLYAIPSHNTHVLLAATVCVIIGLRTHFWLKTHVCRVSHTSCYIEPFLFSCLITNSSSEWTVCCTSHTPWSGWPFLLCCLITNSSSEWTVWCTSHTPSSGCPFLLFLLIANS